MKNWWVSKIVFTYCFYYVVDSSAGNCMVWIHVFLYDCLHNLSLFSQATVSERTEKSDSPVTMDAGTEVDQIVETKDQSVQHTPAHKDDKFTDYSYLFELAVTKGKAVSEVLYCYQCKILRQCKIVCMQCILLVCNFVYACTPWRKQNSQIVSVKSSIKILGRVTPNGDWFLKLYNCDNRLWITLLLALISLHIHWSEHCECRKTIIYTYVSWIYPYIHEHNIP